MLAGESNWRGHRRWSQLGKWCTCATSAHHLQMPLPTPHTHNICCLLCLNWRSVDSGRHRKGGECGAPTPMRVLAIDRRRSVRTPLPVRRSSQHSTTPYFTGHTNIDADACRGHATGISININVRGRGRGSGAGGWARGQGEVVYARAYMQAHTQFVSGMCLTAPICALKDGQASQITL